MKRRIPNSVVVLLRIGDFNPVSFPVVPGDTDGIKFVPPGSVDHGEFVDYMEDMSLLLGCPNCRSFDVREIMVSGTKVQVCDTCGTAEQTPPSN